VSDRLFVYFKFLFTKDFYTRVVPHPEQIFKSLFFTSYYCLRHPDWIKVERKVDGRLNLPVAVFLYRAVLNMRAHPSPNVVEAGCFKGKSTIFLSHGAKDSGKRLKSFELFTGLPVSNAELDSIFKKGDLVSSREEFTSNLLTYGRYETVDLTVGDARETMLPVIAKSGFCLAFLDVDTYEVTKDLLCKLLKIAKGKEVILVHDTFSPGIQKAISESITVSGKNVKKSEPIYDTAMLVVN
jgi:predicted O-methyltransferase YrrM